MSLTKGNHLIDFAKLFLHRKLITQFMLIVVLSTLITIGCGSEEEKIPAGIIPRDKMIAIMIDVQVAEAKIQSNNLSFNDSTKQIALGYYNYVFQKHHIRNSDFKNSFNYYASHMQVMNKMYEEVITGLSKRQAESAGKNKQGVQLK